jgi:HTH-type transcriptional regulator/antitoxin HigA
MSTVLADPAEMIAQGAPRVIHNDAVERYEQEHYFIPAGDPASVVRFLIEQQNLTQRDLIPQFGSESAVSMFLSGKRNLTLEQVRKLSARFKLPGDVFIRKVRKRK